MKHRILYLPEAEEEVIEAYRYYLRRVSLKFASRFRQSLAGNSVQARIRSLPT